jgi:hypothetical protein
MALPTTFGSQVLSTGAQLDAMFAALGAITPLPGTLAGTNALTFTPLSNTPTLTAYANGNVLTGIAVATNTTAVTLATGAISPLGVFKDTEAGPVALTGGEIVIGNAYGFRYDSALAGGSGGFHLQNYAMVTSLQATVTFTNTAANTSQDQNVTVGQATLAKVGDMVFLGPPTSVISGVIYMGYVPAAGTVAVRAANVTAASLTPTGGVFRIGLKGAP